MKKIIGLAVLLISTNVIANDYIGGTVTNNGYELGIVCNSYDNDNKCEKFEVVKSYGTDDSYEVAVMNQINVKKVAKKAKKISSKKLGEKYYTAAIIGTAVGGITLWADTNIVTYSILATGIAVDIVKAPIVGVAFLTHKVTDTFSGKRFKTLIKHMINPERIGKSKRTRARYFYSLTRGFASQSL